MTFAMLLSITFTMCFTGMMYVSYGYSKTTAKHHYCAFSFWMNAALTTMLGLASISTIILSNMYNPL